MKTIKKIVAALLAVLLVLAVGVTAVTAANELTFTMNSTEPTLTKGFTYTIYRVAKLKNGNTGEYTFESGVAENVKTAVNMTEDELKTANTTLLKELDAAADACANPNAPTTVGVKVAELSMAADAADNTTITTDPITQKGIYYARVTAAPDTKTKMSNSTVVWPYYKNGWKYDNSPVDLGKKVDSGTDNVTKVFTDEAESVTEIDLAQGEPAKFTLTADVVGSDTEKVDEYMIWDKMSKGLTFDEDTEKSIKIYLDTELVYDGADVSKNKGFFTVAHEAFTAEHPNYNAAKGDAEYVGGTFISFTATDGAIKGTAKIGTGDNAKSFYGFDKVIIKYEAKLNNNAKIVPGYNPNKDGLIYRRGDDYTYKYPPELRVFTYALRLYKLDGAKSTDEKKEYLDGAEFALYKAADTENAIATGVSGATGEKGLVVFKAVGDNSDLRLEPGDYVVKETKAPKGFVKLTAPINVTIDSNHVTSGEGAGDICYVNGRTDGVKNFPAAIPETGGEGTLLFTIIGGVLVLLSGAMFIVIMRKRSSK